MRRMYSTAVNQVIIKEIKNSSPFLGHTKQNPSRQFDH